ncbi:hypothetical protein Rsub_10882 [Raphidocelis subcapitata]|uniref:Uncharacterized protein n=1 Tax=Raphidocelis subcapitata TaxID=307507 RepID=A0A2V0PCY9_9CHLO|nr:hypothetical protein Rsub_10882 [Raphidocelis subcapitata]|eukprot:GBF97718.1 hypothetical protein Rsub_10882 [Raphidocelis subcapitata]
MSPLDGIMERATARVAEYVKSSGQFRATCDNVFSQLNYRGNGRVATGDAIAASGIFFEQMADSLTEFGLTVEEPNAGEVRGLLKGAGLAGKEELNADDFEALYLAVLKLAAGKCVGSFARKYGSGMVAGVVGLFVAKRIVRAVPIVGTITRPFLALLPSLIAGPIIGVAGIYASDHGGLGSLGELWRNIRGRDGKFISG